MAPKVLLLAVLGAVALTFAQTTSTSTLTTTATDLFVMATPTTASLPLSATFLRDIGDEVEYQVFCATTDATRPQSAPCDFLHFATVQVGSGGMAIDVTRGSTILEISSVMVIDV